MEELDDRKLRRRVAWLNSTGGFTNQIIYAKVAQAANGLEEAKVMQVLKYVEDNWEKVWDPTAWICSSLEKARDASYGLDPSFEQPLRKQIRWLNAGGGFENSITYSKVAEAACNVEPARVMEVLAYLEEGREKVEDPTAWVCAALRKSSASGGGWDNGGGKGGKGGGRDWWESQWNSQWDSEWRQPQWGGAEEDALWKRIQWLNTKGGFDGALAYSAVAEAAPKVRMGRVMEVLKQLEDSWQTIGDPTSWVCATLRRDAQRQGLEPELDQQLRRRVRWLNEAGGFDNGISYSKIAEAAEGVEGSKIFELLKYLEDHWERISGPTEWVCSSLRKAAGLQRGAPGQDGDLQAKLRKRIRWLNGEGGFENTIVYRQVAEASEGLPDDKVMSVLKSLEETAYEAKDPTAWVCAALAKARKGAGAKGWPQDNGKGKGPSNGKGGKEKWSNY